MQAMSDDKLRRLRQCWREGETFTPRVVGDLLDEIDRLRATVAKLPVYADTGEPFVPGRDEAWVIPLRDAIIVHPVWTLASDDDGEWRYMAASTVYYGPAYSARAAARAAMKGGGK